MWAYEFAVSEARGAPSLEVVLDRRCSKLPNGCCGMKFALIDRILELDSHRIVAVKSPTLSEDYLHDHFPGFPVMPGVLMLESMFQAGAWLVRQADNFAHSVVLMKEAKNIKYSGLVKPGEQLRIEATLLSDQDQQSKIKAECRIGEQLVSSGRLVLERSNLADKDASQVDTDKEICRYLQAELQVLMPAAIEIS